MESILEFLKSSTAKRFYWTTFAGFLGLAVIYLEGINWVYAPMLIALIAGITKEINNRISK
jgi:hypothetical protein